MWSDFSRNQNLFHRATTSPSAFMSADRRSGTLRKKVCCFYFVLISSHRLICFKSLNFPCFRGMSPFMMFQRDTDTSPSGVTAPTGQGLTSDLSPFFFNQTLSNDSCPFHSRNIKLRCIKDRTDWLSTQPTVFSWRG